MALEAGDIFFKESAAYWRPGDLIRTEHGLAKVNSSYWIGHADVYRTQLTLMEPKATMDFVLKSSLEQEAYAMQKDPRPVRAGDRVGDGVAVEANDKEGYAKIVVGLPKAVDDVDRPGPVATEPIKLSWPKFLDLCELHPGIKANLLGQIKALFGQPVEIG
jgi:hypothetical protein